MGTETRVLHAVVNMNRGGAETLIMNLYRRIDRKRLQFDFLTCREGVYDDEIRALGGVVHRVPWVTEAGPLGYARALDRFFAEHGHYRIVHAHMDRMSGWVLRAARRAGIPVRIAHSHNTKSEGNALIRLYKWASGRLIEANATDRFACSEAAAAWLFGGRASEAGSFATPSTAARSHSIRKSGGRRGPSSACAPGSLPSATSAGSARRRIMPS